jgi:hypothetical protein
MFVYVPDSLGKKDKAVNHTNVQRATFITFSYALFFKS